MQRVHGYYLYEVGYKVHPIGSFQADRTTYREAHFPLIVAEGALGPFLQGSIFQFKLCQQDGHALLEEIRAVLAKIRQEDPNSETKLDVFDVYPLQSALTRFETVLSAEFGLSALYIVQRKGGLDTMDLIENGAAHFPLDLGVKVPEAIEDVQQGARCLAYELNTAAGFHFHRANESVLQAYFRAVTNGAPKPKNPNMGVLLAKLDELNAGDEKVKSALRALKDLHRNPLIHPEHSIPTTEAAISLLSQIRACVGYMLEVIPLVEEPPSIGAGVAQIESAGR